MADDVKEKPPALQLLKQDWDRFALYVLTFVHMGAFLGIIGPTLLHLAAQTDTNVQGQAIILGLRSVGFFLGSLLAGFCFDRFGHGNELLLITFVLAGALTLFIPSTSSVYAYGLMSVGQAMTCGMMDNLVQVMIIKHFNANLNPFMQSIHCGFGIGALLSPIIVRPGQEVICLRAVGK